MVNDQIDAQFFFLIYLFQFSTRVKQYRAHHQENHLCQHNIWYRWPPSMQFGKFLPDLHTRPSPTQSDIPDVVLIQLILLMISTRLLETCRELK
jgi:hypothetical protein